MKRKQKRVAGGILFLLFMALCVPAFSGALAEAANEPLVVPIVQAMNVFGTEMLMAWVPVGGFALGLIAVGALVWMAISTAKAARESKKQTQLLTNLSERFKDGVAVKSPIKAELTAWPREGYALVSCEAMEQLAAIARLGGVFSMQSGTQMQQPIEPPPAPVREGEEPELLALANRLAGVASAPEWNNIVKEAGWRAIQLQSNPTEKGTYIADDSGYSIIACLMHGVEPQMAYVVPSYQDPNASESRWSEFYSVNEDMSVKNYLLEALPVMYIERGTFFLQKSKGRLIRRPQYY